MFFTIHKHGYFEEDGSFTGTSIEVSFRSKHQLDLFAIYEIYWYQGYASYGKIRYYIAGNWRKKL